MSGNAEPFPMGGEYVMEGGYADGGYADGGYADGGYADAGTATAAAIAATVLRAANRAAIAVASARRA